MDSFKNTPKEETQVNGDESCNIPISKEAPTLCYKCLTKEQSHTLLTESTRLSECCSDSRLLLEEGKSVLTECEANLQLCSEKSSDLESILAIRETQLTDSQKRISDLENGSTWESIWDYGWPILTGLLASYAAADYMGNHSKWAIKTP